MLSIQNFQSFFLSLLCVMVRWELNTCGYHGEDGLIYLGKRQGEAFGPTYTTGDIVGGGINYDSQEFFFT